MANSRRILYLDCFSGVSGDMFLGALLDAGASESAIREGLSLLSLDKEFVLQVQKTKQMEICGTKISVLLKSSNEQDLEHCHDHNHSHHHDDSRSYLDICRLIETSALNPQVRKFALQVFKLIGEAEAAIHGIDLPAVHFHEVGAIDSIVDIVGVALALDNLSVDEVICSPLADGIGTISCRHGILPVPVPAVVKMLEGTNIPYRSGTCDTELVTPTGLGLVKAVCRSFGMMPQMEIIKAGYGFGQRNIGRLNALRIVMGEQKTPDKQDEAMMQECSANPYMDEVVLLSCNLDNSTPEQLGYAAGRLMQSGALDVAFEPLMMKKWRPGQMLLVVAPLDLEESLVRLIFELTGTIGIRRQKTQRHIMQREIQARSTALGQVRFKINRWHDLCKAYPEQEDLIRVAENAGISPMEAEKIIGSCCGLT